MAPAPAVGAQFVLPQSTDIYVVMGPFLDAVTGLALTGLTIPNTEVFISKNNEDFVAKTNATALSHMQNGFYKVTLDAADVNVTGLVKDNILIISINHEGALPVWKEFRVDPSLAPV